MHRASKVFILEFNPYILFARQVLKRLGFRALKPERNILFLEDLRDLIDIFGFDIIDKGYRFAIPSKFFGLGDIIDSLLPRTMLLRRLCFGQYVIFRLHPFEPSNFVCFYVVFVVFWKAKNEESFMFLLS